MKTYKHAVITGATSGIGLAFAHQLAEAGTHLILVARRTERLQKIAEELKLKHKIEVDILTIDLADPVLVDQIIVFCETRNYEIDLLINNAGLGPYKKFTSGILSNHLMVQQVNATAPMVLSHQFAAHMFEHQKPSSILNVASVAGMIPVSGFAVYAATKSFLSAFSNILSYEFKNTNINVSCLYPGATETEFSDKNNQVIIGRHMLFMSADSVAKSGLDGTRNNQMMIVPGFLNKLQIVLSRWIPVGLLLKISNRAMSAAVREKSI